MSCNQPEAFDPYHRWLGIPPKHQPADHYRLLGIDRFEDDPEVSFCTSCCNLWIAEDACLDPLP